MSKLSRRCAITASAAPDDLNVLPCLDWRGTPFDALGRSPDLDSRDRDPATGGQTVPLVRHLERLDHRELEALVRKKAITPSTTRTSRSVRIVETIALAAIAIYFLSAIGVLV